MSVPNVTDAHVGPLAVQSKHTLFAGSDSIFAKNLSTKGFGAMASISVPIAQEPRRSAARPQDAQDGRARRWRGVVRCLEKILGEKKRARVERRFHGLRIGAPAGRGRQGVSFGFPRSRSVGRGLLWAVDVQGLGGTSLAPSSAPPELDGLEPKTEAGLRMPTERPSPKNPLPQATAARADLYRVARPSPSLLQLLPTAVRSRDVPTGIPRGPCSSCLD